MRLNESKKFSNFVLLLVFLFDIKRNESIIYLLNILIRYCKSNNLTLSIFLSYFFMSRKRFLENLKDRFERALIFNNFIIS